eukprot:TRINITY_DN314_c1_g1_i1.p1 TRINITY_DN314_c1_g1~~TRINITY_DN314_c1_g1_i1.p1  ORF type:complete len:198 (-),score=24.78 TRINITY_DN314_c1_g1_i1:195-788(-)
MKLFFILLVVLLSSIVLVGSLSSEQKALKIEGSLRANVTIAKTRVLATGVRGQYTAFLRADGSFVIHDVPPGSYLIQVLSTEYNFPQVRVDVSSRPDVKTKAQLFNIQNTNTPYPLSLEPESVATFFQRRESFNIFSLLGNPMLIMVLFTVGIMFVLPKLKDLTDEVEQESRQAQVAPNSQPSLTGGAAPRKERGRN